LKAWRGAPNWTPSSGNGAAGLGYVFESIIAVVVWGVLLGWGYGSAFGVFLGAMIHGIINVGIFYRDGAPNGATLPSSLAFCCSVPYCRIAASAASP
jgi:hypothetical protein